MREYLKLYIDGQWVSPSDSKTAEVINPATEQVSGRIALGNEADVDKAVQAARKAFASWSQTSRKQRIELLEAIQAEYTKRKAAIGAADGIGARLPCGSWRRSSGHRN
jgi:aldehyde dehydrogenase (NAD+)